MQNWCRILTCYLCFLGRVFKQQTLHKHLLLLQLLLLPRRGCWVLNSSGAGVRLRGAARPAKEAQLLRALLLSFSTQPSSPAALITILAVLYRNGCCLHRCTGDFRKFQRWKAAKRKLMLLFQIHQNLSGYHTVIEQLLTLGISSIKKHAGAYWNWTFIKTFAIYSWTLWWRSHIWGFSASEPNRFACKTKKKAADWYSFCSQLS